MVRPEAWCPAAAASPRDQIKTPLTPVRRELYTLATLALAALLLLSLASLGRGEWSEVAEPSVQLCSQGGTEATCVVLSW